jgi:hypothetical protein
MQTQLYAAILYVGLQLRVIHLVLANNKHLRADIVAVVAFCVHSNRIPAKMAAGRPDEQIRKQICFKASNQQAKPILVA